MQKDYSIAKTEQFILVSKQIEEVREVMFQNPFHWPNFLHETLQCGIIDCKPNLWEQLKLQMIKIARLLIIYLSILICFPTKIMNIFFLTKTF